MNRPLPTLLAVLLLSACAVDRASVLVNSPELIDQYDKASAEEQSLQAELPVLEQAARDAVASVDPSDDAPAAEALAQANARLQSAEEQLAALEERVVRKQAAPLGGILPYGLGYLAVEAVAAFASRRKRNLYVSALRSISKGQLLVSAGEVLKALGAIHSQPPPA